MLKKLFQKKQASPAAHETAPLGLVVGGAFQVDLLDVRAQADQYRFEVEDERVVIDRGGVIDMGDNTLAHRFYGNRTAQGDYGAILQVLTDAHDQTQGIREITLYQHFDRIMPNTAAEWDEFLSPTGWFRLPEWELDDGTIYKRIWFPDSPDGVELVRFHENLFRSRDRSDQQECMHECMLFGRQIGESGRGELLLPSVVTSDGPQSRVIDLWIGIDVSLSQLEVY